MRIFRKLLFFLLSGSLFVVPFQGTAQNQKPIGRNEKERGIEMLRRIKKEIKDNYYDRNYHGLNLDETFSKSEKLIEQATTNGQILGIIGATLMQFNDSHLYFRPPEFTNTFEYGWDLRMVGEVCRVAATKPDSDAAKKLKPGDAILSINGVNIDRDTLWKMEYLLKRLRPEPMVEFVVQTDNGEPRRVEVETKVIPGKKVNVINTEFQLRNGKSMAVNPLESHRFAEPGNDTVIWKMPGFNLLPDDVDKVMKKILPHRNLILDLRGNGGGYVVMLERLTGYFFNHEVKISELSGRDYKKGKASVAKPQPERQFSGKVIILIDSKSGSAAEIFPRVMQIEKRATVIGDRSSGKVMQSYRFQDSYGDGNYIFYGASITNADVILTDGKSLERTGVLPDELILPTGEDMANGRDPVLAHALKLVGVEITPEKAGTLFPFKWQ